LSAARLRCLDLGSFEDALRDLMAAKPLLREFFEDSESFASAMALEMHCLQAKNDGAGAARAAAERAAFLSERPHLKADQIERALKREPERRTGAEDETIAGRIALVRGFDELEKLQGVAFLDKVEQLATETLHQSDEEATYITGMILSLAGDRLAGEGKKERALEYYLRAVAAHPASFEHRANVGLCLLNLGRFQEAAEVGLKLAVDDPGSHLGFLICGSAAYRSADYALSEQMLREALVRKPDQVLAKDLLGKTEQERLSLTLQGRPLPPTLVRTFSPTTHAAFLDYLRDFAKRARLNSDSFWKKRSEHKLVQNPESAGRALLAQDVTATCRTTAIYKETILAGGRIDLIMNVLGSEFITELKICGASYSQDWAEGGFDQLKQYMRERGATRAYLVVFDARADQGGDKALPTSSDVGDGMTVFCVAVNIRGMDK
jgi:tetratricopeptide (TPR) repeat protein